MRDVKDAKERRLFGYLIPATLVFAYVSCMVLGLSESPAFRLVVYAVGVGALVIGAAGLIRAARRRWRRRRENPPRFLILLLWQKLVIIMVLFSLAASNVTANFGIRVIPESASFAGLVTSTVVFAEVSLLLYFGYRDDGRQLSIPTHPGPLVWMLRPGSEARDG